MGLTMPLAYVYVTEMSSTIFRGTMIAFYINYQIYLITYFE